MGISVEPSVHGPTRVMNVTPVSDSGFGKSPSSRVKLYLVRDMAKTNFASLAAFTPGGYLPTPQPKNVGPQPSAGIVLVRFGVYSGSGGRQSQNTWGSLTTYPDIYFPMEVPPAGDANTGNPLQRAALQERRSWISPPHFCRRSGWEVR